MPKSFKVFGPFEIPLDPQVRVKSIRLRCPDFWDQSIMHSELADKRGCYIFAIRASKGFTPIYVGKATRSFKVECFSSHKIAGHYHKALVNSKRGTPVMFFVVLNSTSSELREPAKKAVDSVEKYLIQSALIKNPELSNIKGTKPELWSIDGIVRSSQGSASKASRTFKKALGL